MPHLAIAYSSNLESALDMSALCDWLRRAAVEIEAFPFASVRVRAFATNHYSITDGNPDHGFIDISVRLRGGRSLEVRKAATATIFEAAKRFLEPVMATRSIALSLEMRDIDPELSPKAGNIRDHLPPEIT